MYHMLQRLFGNAILKKEKYHKKTKIWTTNSSEQDMIAAVQS